jgi:polyhydroxyalkanoate synthesis regulator phasin
MIIKKLPHWVLSSKSPSFYETEGGTAIEQTAIMYKKVQELIDSYNSFVDEINKEIDDFISNTLTNQEEFELKINQMIHDFTELVTLELKSQDVAIKEAIDYMKTHLDGTIKDMLLNLFESEQLKLEYVYNDETEELDILGVVVRERGVE